MLHGYCFSMEQKWISEVHFSQTPLQVAIEYGQIEMVRLLVCDFGADMDAENAQGQEILEIALCSREY